MKGSDARVSGETSRGGEEPSGGASRVKNKAIRADGGVGDIRSGKEAVPDL